MTNDAINQAMAELDGCVCTEWHWKGSGDTYIIEQDGAAVSNSCYSEQEAWASLQINYTEDLNAVARVVGKLSDMDRIVYQSNLNEMCEDPPYAIDALPAARCESILRACGKWVEG